MILVKSRLFGQIRRPAAVGILTTNAFLTAAALMLVLSACKPGAKNGTGATADQGTNTQTTVPCVANPPAAVPLAKSTAKERRIFSLLDDQHLAGAKAIIAADPSAVNVRNDDGDTPLVAIARSTTQTYVITLDAGARGTAQDVGTAKSDDVPLLAQLLVAKGADLNAKDNGDLSPLSAALITGKSSLAKFLIKNCADVNLAGTQSARPLHYAANYGNLELTQALLAAGADVNVKGQGSTPLIQATHNGYQEVAQALLAAKADVNAKTNDGVTALFVASAHGHLGLVQALLAAKADVNEKASDGSTALIVASHNGHLEVVQALLAANADVNEKANDGSTALMQASTNGHQEIVKLLKSAGAAER